MTITKKEIIAYLNGTVESIKDSFERKFYHICEEEAQELIGLSWFLYSMKLINQEIRENYLEIAWEFKYKAFKLK